MSRLSRFTTEFERRSDDEIFGDHRIKLYKELRKLTGVEVQVQPVVEVAEDRLHRIRASRAEGIAESR